MALPVVTQYLGGQVEGNSIGMMVNISVLLARKIFVRNLVFSHRVDNDNN